MSIHKELEALRERLTKYRIATMAEETGVAPATIYRIISGALKSPSYQIVRTLQTWMDAQ